MWTLFYLFILFGDIQTNYWVWFSCIFRPLKNIHIHARAKTYFDIRGLSCHLTVSFVGQGSMTWLLCLSIEKKRHQPYQTRDSLLYPRGKIYHVFSHTLTNILFMNFQMMIGQIILHIVWLNSSSQITLLSQSFKGYK